MSRAREFADLAGSADAGGLTGRNLIINGAMQVAQRGTSKTATAQATYLLDRFMAYTGDYANYGYTVSQTTDAPTGFSNSLKYNFDDADTSPATEHSLYYRFEGQDLQHLKKGTASAESVTLSFWCKASLAGTYIAELMDVDNSNRHINKSYSISSANTWEYKTITFEGDTTGTLTNDNSTSLDIAFWLAANSSNTSGTLQTSWGTLSQANRAVGQTNLGATVNNAFYITGVQLELGDTATPFEHRSFGDELARCQRYYAESNWVGTQVLDGNNTNRNLIPAPPQSMRGNPTITVFNPSTGTANQGYCFSSGVTATISYIGGFNSLNTFQIGTGTYLQSDNNDRYTSFQMKMDAEL